MHLTALDVMLMDSRYSLEHLINTIYSINKQTEPMHPLSYEVSQLYAAVGYLRMQLIIIATYTYVLIILN